jgi:hypothetical protein
MVVKTATDDMADEVLAVDEAKPSEGDVPGVEESDKLAPEGEEAGKDGSGSANADTDKEEHAVVDEEEEGPPKVAEAKWTPAEIPGPLYQACHPPLRATEGY